MAEHERPGEEGKVRKNNGKEANIFDTFLSRRAAEIVRGNAELCALPVLQRHSGLLILEVAVAECWETLKV